jgi:transposase
MKQRTFSAQFKADAVKLVVEQRLAAAQVSKDLGIGISTLEKWLSQARKSKPKATTETEQEELKRLRKEVHYLKMERDILKKATAYFAKTSLPEESGS